MLLFDLLKWPAYSLNSQKRESEHSVALKGSINNKNRLWEFLFFWVVCFNTTAMPGRDFNGPECRPEFKNKEMMFAPLGVRRRCFDPHPVRLPRRSHKSL